MQRLSRRLLRSVTWIIVYLFLAREGFAQDAATQLPQDTGICLATNDSSCGLWVGAGCSVQTGFAWQFEGVDEAGAGAFATRFHLEEAGSVCAILFWLAQVGNHTNEVADVFLWEDNSGEPGAVITSSIGVDVGPSAFWPSISQHAVAVEACVSGDVWAGYNGRWSGREAAYYIGADLEENGFASMTKIGSGLGYPTGWQSLSAVWEPATLAIELEVDECDIDPTLESTWGEVKQAFRTP